MSIYDKKGVRLLFIMLSSLMLAVVMVACAKQEPTGEETADIPQEVQNAAENYLEAFKKGGAAESNMHTILRKNFVNSTLRKADRHWRTTKLRRSKN